MGTNSNYALRLPLSLKTAAEELARKDGSSLNQFIVTAVAEKLASLKTADYFSDRASRADIAAFDRFMSRDGGVLPRPEDRWDGGPAEGLASGDGGPKAGRG